LFVHAVYFWLEDGLSGEDRDTFVRGVTSLTTIETVQHGHVGTPADTNRPIIERGYSYALVLFFADLAAHDSYQTHPVHDRFREQCGTFWRKVLIYDSVSSA
jgi:Stress responsive A/B Barrel Domain